jgi:hypothetical protein
MSETPRTDAAMFYADDAVSTPPYFQRGAEVVHAEFARSLERALSASQARERVMREALENIVTVHDMYCQNTIGVSAHSYNLCNIAEEALAESGEDKT